MLSGARSGTMMLGVFSDIQAGIQPRHAHTVCTLLHYHPHTCMMCQGNSAHGCSHIQETTSLVEMKGGFPVFTEGKTTTVLNTRNWTKGR